MEAKYNPKVYWEQRLSGRLDIASVGQQGLGHVYNDWLYRARLRAMRRALKKLRIGILGKSLMDVGIGSGAWIRFWEECGVSRIVGMDITSASVGALRNKYPQFEFLEGDISVELPVIQERFDIVTVLDVLFHITDNAAFSHAIRNISTLVKQGGWVIISDSFCSKSWGPFYHEYHRTYAHYMKEFRLTGMEPVHFEPIFFTMTTPICNLDFWYTRFFAHFTKGVLWLVGKLSASRKMEGMNHLIGFSLYLLDALLCQAAGTGTSLKLLFIRKG